MQATANSTSSWTILTLIEWGAQYLKERGFEDARLNIELLLSHVLHLKR
ncbi:MAG TPA: peptide chain release factor N(5)-glutamine methyltransferase, partial [Bacteroidetes bacterium]|nr:peptide chain release factor N(5)-glutamine methyltransferase [Bacteroidota bacterium]